eukprot:31561-Pelagococcus_subviridis.AAC.8
MCVRSLCRPAAQDVVRTEQTDVDVAVREVGPQRHGTERRDEDVFVAEASVHERRDVRENRASSSLALPRRLQGVDELVHEPRDGAARAPSLAVRARGGGGGGRRRRRRRRGRAARHRATSAGAAARARGRPPGHAAGVDGRDGGARARFERLAGASDGALDAAARPRRDLAAATSPPSPARDLARAFSRVLSARAGASA